MDYETTREVISYAGMALAVAPFVYFGIKKLMEENKRLMINYSNPQISQEEESLLVRLALREISPEIENRHVKAYLKLHPESSSGEKVFLERVQKIPFLQEELENQKGRLKSLLSKEDASINIRFMEIQ